MGKKICWAIILITIAVNVVMLQWTIEAYLGVEYEKIYTYTIVGVVSSVIAFLTYLKWRKLEYTN
ncbi:MULTISPECIES: hypothetical protein [Alkalihalobacterium]|uniref:Phage holin n=1 Tax=Alkalihalobacterium chitinilyticum TaxID=2980103 RepID=A0ABT5VKD7_9BACI|nr:MULTISPECIES: hypothetical protein [Alkalihalobacterium]MDE5415912.1 hypothetical protein [Alkalihalobacterium chitinilyticum]